MNKIETKELHEKMNELQALNAELLLLTKREKIWERLALTLRERAKAKNILLESLDFREDDLPVLEDLMPEYRDMSKTLFSILSTALAQLSKEIEYDEN